MLSLYSRVLSALSLPRCVVGISCLSLIYWQSRRLRLPLMFHSKRRSIHQVAIALGSNIGNRLNYIEDSLLEMQKSIGSCVKTSALYETVAAYTENDNDKSTSPKYLNAAVLLNTEFLPIEILKKLQDIEIALGRDEPNKRNKNANRTIDLDILFYDNQIVNYTQPINLQIPHWGIHERNFVLFPLNDIMPNYIHPTLNMPIKKLLERNMSRSLDGRTKDGRNLVPLRRVAIGNKLFDVESGDSHVVGIINTTPDSFSDGDPTMDSEKRIKSALEMVKDGAALIDIGGVSRAPGRNAVQPDEELNRILPVLSVLKQNSEIKVPISVDTDSAIVLKRAIETGADMLNNSSGTFDDDLLKLIKEKRITVVYMHARGNPITMDHFPKYEDVVENVCDEMNVWCAALEGAGIPRWRYLLDAGLGFGKRNEENVQLLHNFQTLRNNLPSGAAFYVGYSRKRYIRFLLDGKEAAPGTTQPFNETELSDVVHGGSAMACWSYLNGVNFIRTHDVKPVVCALKVFRAVTPATSVQQQFGVSSEINL